MIALGKMSFLGLGVVAGIVSVMGVHLASAQSRTTNAVAATTTVTADTDVSRIRQGYAKPYQVQLVNGPFILTDLAVRGSTSDISVHIVPGSTCSTSGDPILYTDTTPHHGMRIAVPTGSVACITSNSSNGTAWSGFIPY
ncbi:hypothetical protein LVJ94_28440 [Pendulispora rubella]|uniref:Uncharacterized protein n=1 Tax=Pendulispora rubella TaxID=2741070 RepID=A0ABZ2KU70_9BACT